jgi:hypothetical protein
MDSTPCINKAVRLVYLIRAFEAGRVATTGELAGELSVSPRTILRDMVDLQSEPLRVPLTCDSTRHGLRWSLVTTLPAKAGRFPEHARHGVGSGGVDENGGDAVPGA